MQCYLAVDLGAESGRVIEGRIENDAIQLTERSRFVNGMWSLGKYTHWNILNLFDGMKKGFAQSVEAGNTPASIGVDTWGVDFALLAENDELLGLPVCYRDRRNEGMMDAFAEVMPPEEVYARTGIQFMPFNTLYQLFAMSRAKSPLLAHAKQLLFMPDFFHFLFSGEKKIEYSIASTSQLVNVEKRDWDRDILKAAGIPEHIFSPFVEPGTQVGTASVELQKETGLGPIPVITPAGHDTASAVAAAPATGEDWAYISSGTWSLMGIETPEPVHTEEARAANLTNEGGVNGTIRLLKNIMGLWLVQRCRAGFDKQYDYAELVKMAEAAPAFQSIIDPNNLRFYNPVSMPEEIAAFCKETDQPVPYSPGAFVRCCLESLALEYRTALEMLRKVQPRPINKIHVVGGGSKNQLLCQMTADATGVPVYGGPDEATALGNLIVQAMGLGHIKSLEEARALVARSFPLVEYQPSNATAWEAQLDRFRALKG